jgi:adenylate kinase family enzyme
MRKVILITGPGGTGKSTIAELIEKECGYVLLDGDHEDTEFFPSGGQWLSDNSVKLTKAHHKILEKAKELVEEGKKVVIDYIVFGNYLDFFRSFEETFRDDLQIVVLFPNQEKAIQRDKERECWTTGVERIEAVYREYEDIRDELGSDKYLDTSGETAEESFEKYFK